MKVYVPKNSIRAFKVLMPCILFSCCIVYWIIIISQNYYKLASNLQGVVYTVIIICFAVEIYRILDEYCSQQITINEDNMLVNTKRNTTNIEYRDITKIQFKYFFFGGKIQIYINNNETITLLPIFKDYETLSYDLMELAKFNDIPYDSI